MTTVTKKEVEQDLAGVLARVKDGETFVIEEGGKPIGRLAPFQEFAEKRRFRIGALEGKGVIPPDIKTPYEAEINEMFYGE